MIEKSKQFWYLYSALAILVLIRIIPFLYPESRTWGFNHLIFLPAGYSFAFFGISAFALVLPFIKKSEIWGERFIDWFSNTFFECERRLLYRMLFILPFALLFIIFTMPTHFLGDGYSILKNIASESNTLYKWSEIGVIILLEQLRAIVGSPTVRSSTLVIQIVSVCSGVVTIWLFFAIAQIISINKIRQLLIFSSSLLSGSLLLWFGYIEHYPILWIFMTTFLYFAIKYIKCGNGLIPMWIFLLIGMALHMQISIFLPGALYLTLLFRSDKTKRNSNKNYTWLYTTVICVIIGSIFIYKYLTDIYFQAMFIDVISSNLSDMQYSLFAANHLIDIINQTVLLTPLLFVYITLIRINELSHTYKYETIFLIITSVGGLLFLFLIDPKLGMPRDWDLFALTIYPLTILFIFKSNVTISNLIKRFVLSIILLLIIFPVPYMATNLQRESSVAYAESLIAMDTGRSLSVLFNLYSYHHNRGDFAKADSLEQTYKFSLPRRNKCDSVIKALKRRDMELAASILNRIEPNDFDGYYQSIMSRFNYLQGNYELSLKYIEKAIQLGRYYANYYGDRAKIYMAQSDYKKALDDLRHGYRLDNSRKYIIDGLANLHFLMQEYDSTIYYSEKRLQIDSSNPNFYYMLAKSYAHKRDLNMAQKYFERFAEYNSSAESYKSKFNELSELINRLKTIQ